MLRAKKWGVVLAGLLLCVVTLAFCFNGAPLAVSAADTQQSVENEAPPIQPRFGGKVSGAINVGNHPVQYEFTAENYAWPASDRAVIVVTSNAMYCSVSFKVEFVWVKSDNVTVDMRTTWQQPTRIGYDQGKFEDVTYNPTTLLSNKRWICADDDARYVEGDPGHRWACGYIRVHMKIKVTDEFVETKEVVEVAWF